MLKSPVCHRGMRLYGWGGMISAGGRCHEAPRWDHSRNVQIYRPFRLTHNYHTGGPRATCGGGPAGPGALLVGTETLLGGGATRAEAIVMEQLRASISVPFAGGRDGRRSGMEVEHPIPEDTEALPCRLSAATPRQKARTPTVKPHRGMLRE